MSEGIFFFIILTLGGGACGGGAVNIENVLECH